MAMGGLRRGRIISAVLVSAALLTGASATSSAAGATNNSLFWFHCTFSHRLADDPIVHPGEPGVSHMHDFFGNASTDAYSTDASMAGQATTCEVGGDTAGYWAPTLTLQGAPVPIVWSNAYYWGIVGMTRSFPAGLREVAGSTAGTPSGTGGTWRRVGWVCTNSGVVTAAPRDCGVGKVKATVTFPACWDGVSLDSADHHSHLAYPSGSGICPADHPVLLPRLAFHVIYNVHNGTGALLSSDIMAGAPSGSTLHADFWNTWDQSVLDDLVNRCLYLGEICKHLTA